MPSDDRQVVYRFERNFDCEFPGSPEWTEDNPQKEEREIFFTNGSKTDAVLYSEKLECELSIPLAFRYRFAISSLHTHINKYRYSNEGRH